jgi:hypothetical protein
MLLSNREICAARGFPCYKTERIYLNHRSLLGSSKTQSRKSLVCFRKSCDFLPVSRLARKSPTSIPPAQPGQLRYQCASAKADEKRETEPSSPTNKINTSEQNVETESEVPPLIKGNKVS